MVKTNDDIILYDTDALYDSKMIYDPEILATQNIELEIVGIFSVNRPKNKTDNDYMYDELENKIYTSNKVVENIVNFSVTEYKKIDQDAVDQYLSGITITPLFVLKDPLNLDKFKASITKDVPEYYKITDNSGNYKKIAAPMKNMKWISSVVLYVSIGATLLILSLLITLFLRDRKHEIGIYLALGERKYKVVSQILIEVLLISFAGITMSLFAGGIIASSVSKEMLNNELIAAADKPDMYYDGSSLDWLGYSATVSEEDLMSAYNVTLNGYTTLLFYIVGLTTVLVSTIVPIFYITRLIPKKVWM